MSVLSIISLCCENALATDLSSDSQNFAVPLDEISTEISNIETTSTETLNDLESSSYYNNAQTLRDVDYPVPQYYYRKKSVRKFKQWSPYRRVSGNLQTKNYTGTIRVDRQTTFSTSIHGAINGINVTLGGSVTSSASYSINVGKNRRVYIGCRVLMNVESGIREKVNAKTGQVVSRNNYTVKRPSSIPEYTLLNY